MLFDEVLETLIDGKWHSIEMVEKSLNRLGKKTRLVLSFLLKYEFIELDSSRKNVKIDSNMRDLIILLSQSFPQEIS